ncbi:MAG TPA: cache domain-containing protein [Aromatoleum sp.]|uniref:cache domain-containing protein n=1 Tax=Aromatoleum sp. TaxID=2307007 RepID=UPI002B45E1E8|nr:cache domain-containing protein [Aromatoleum sp.]HJV27041.1 cache domain-containing protein [Aromatoleum sp.]
MYFLRKLFALIAASLVFMSVSHASVTPDEAKALVDKAVAHVKQVGAEQAFKAFNDPAGPWVKGELYILVYDFQGNNLVLGSNPKMNGKNLWDIKSPDGKFVVREFVDLVKAKGSGWIDYQWSNPESKKIENKATYVTRVPGMEAIIGCGIYKN